MATASKVLSTFSVPSFLIGAAASAYYFRRQTEQNETTPSLTDSRSHDLFKYGAPHRDQQHVYADHALCYDQARKSPVWVLEHLTHEHLKGDATRKFSKFMPDPNIQQRFSASNEDFWNSGWSRGHMAAAGNYKRSQRAMDDTFFLSNVVAQDLDNNGRFWNLMEIYSRDLTSKFESVNIISGPLFLPTLAEGGKTFTKYEVIGDGQVPVPTHLFKVLIAEKPREGNMPVSNEQVALGAFLVPNEPIPTDQKLTDYQIPLARLEQLSGLDLVPKLDRDRIVNLCQVEGCRLMDARAFEMMNLARRMNGARSESYLMKSWIAVQEKGLDEDVTLQKVYKERLKEIRKVNKEKKNKVAASAG